MLKILLVDDEEIELDGMAELIDWEKYGFTLIGTALNGQNGLALIQEKSPDVVITDVKMPKMDGLQMIEAAHEQGYDGIFVVLSGYGEYEYTSRAMQMGIKHYILKPSEKKQITEVLEKVRAEHQAREQNRTRTTKMEHEVRRMTTITREKILREILLGREKLEHAVGLDEKLYDPNFKVVLLALHCERGIDLLEQYAITNMMAEILPKGSLVGDSSLAKDVFLLVDAAVYDQLPGACARLCMEFTRFNADGIVMAGSTCDTAENLPELYRQVNLVLKISGTPGKLTLFGRPPTDKNALLHNADYAALQSCRTYVELCFECSVLLLYLKLQQIEDDDLAEIAYWVCHQLCGTTVKPQTADYTKILHYVVDTVWKHRTESVALTKSERTNQEILREFYGNLPDMDFSMQKLSREILFMNPDYLSRKLYTLTGEKFGEHLTADRIRIAKRLMALCPDAKLSAIAETVGFAPDEQYFCRVFRKATDMTPREYVRNLNRVDIGNIENRFERKVNGEDCPI